MMGDVRLRRHPTHHPFGAVLAVTGAFWGVGAEAVPVDAWRNSALRCVDQIAEGAVAWPKRSVSEGDVGVWKTESESPNGLMTRSCEVTHSEDLPRDNVEALAKEYADLSRQWIDQGFFEVQTTWGWRRGEGDTSSMLHSTESNPRGCVVEINFRSQLERGSVLFLVKEVAQLPCGETVRD